jgi:molecular chaperone GrpE
MTDENIQQNTTEPTSQPTELEISKKQAEEYLNNWKRERADFINYKKDEAKRVEEFVKYANESIILQLLDVVDDLDIAAKQEADAEATKQIIKKTEDLLKKYGVERIKLDGKFDPELHEAVSTEPGGEKIEEVRAGHTMYGKVIRPTRIKIIK